MPQLSQIGEIYASQLFWLAIVFALIYFGIGKAMVPRIEATVADRKGRVDADLAAAETARATVRDSEQAYGAGLEIARSRAATIVADARARAAAATERRLTESDAASAARLAASSADLERERHLADGELEAVMVEAVGQIVSRLSGIDLDRAAIERQVKSELAHV